MANGASNQLSPYAMVRLHADVHAGRMSRETGCITENVCASS